MTAPMTIDEIVMRAPADQIFSAAAEVEHWPEFLPHYRWVRVLREEHEGRTVEMAARRGMIPVKWTSLQTWNRERREVYYDHVGGPTRGMHVLWQIIPQGEEALVRIVHELRLRAPLVRSALGLYITAEVFVRQIAGQTLWHLKQHLEGHAVAVRGVSAQAEPFPSSARGIPRAAGPHRSG